MKFRIFSFVLLLNLLVHNIWGMDGAGPSTPKRLLGWKAVKHEDLTQDAILQLLPRHTPPIEDENTKYKCPICLDTAHNYSVVTLTYGHSFHQRCIARWRDQSTQCPLCRQDFPVIPLPLNLRI